MAPTSASGEAAPQFSEPPRKKQRVSTPEPLIDNITSTSIPGAKANELVNMDDDHPRNTTNNDHDAQTERELEVGILHYVNSTNLGFTGILKKRYVHLLFWNWFNTILSYFIVYFCFLNFGR